MKTYTAAKMDYICFFPPSRVPEPGKQVACSSGPSAGESNVLFRMFWDNRRLRPGLRMSDSSGILKRTKFQLWWGRPTYLQPEMFPGDLSVFPKPYCWWGRGAGSQRWVTPGFRPAVISSFITVSVFENFWVRLQWEHRLLRFFAKPLHYSPFSPAVCIFAVVSFACHALQACEVSQKLQTVTSFAKKI